MLKDTNELTVEFVENNINLVKGLYDALRVVDPVGKSVLLHNEGVLIKKEGSCFSEVNKKRICDNCISMRAINSNSTFMKIENVDEKLYLISAMPLEYKGKTYAVELIKEVTNSLFYGNSIIGGTHKVENIVKDMKKIATKDALTGIYNRRFIDERLPVDMAWCMDNDEPISIIMADVDYFKNINDTYGHTTGDFVLKEFSKKLKKCMREKKDWIARYGGEEFIVCIPGADEKIALKVANRMLSSIKNMELNLDNGKVNVTASFGIATLYNNHISQEEFIDSADKKLYLAKETGRNKIVV